MVFRWDGPTLAGASARFHDLHEDADMAYGWTVMNCRSTQGSTKGLIGVLTPNIDACYQAVLDSINSTSQAQRACSENLTETLDRFVKAEDAAVAKVDDIFDEYGRMPDGDRPHLEDPDSYVNPKKRGPKDPHLGPVGSKLPPPDLSRFNSDLPTQLLEVPTDPDFRVLECIQSLLNLGIEQSVLDILIKIAELAGYQGSIDNIRETLWGDWEGVHKQGQGFVSLALFWAREAGTTERDAGHLLTTWDGESAATADKYFGHLAGIYRDLSGEASSLGTQLKDCALGVQMLSVDLETAFSELFTMSNIIKNTAGADYGKMLSQILKQLPRGAYLLMVILGLLQLVGQLIHTVCGILLSLQGTLISFHNNFKKA